MIKIERTSVMNFENAVRGARNPMNSWERMDSRYDENGVFVLGESDLSLCRRLSRAGSDHRKYLRQIFVCADITGPLYWWKEFDTYKVGTVSDSCSTMHKIQAKEFSRGDFSCERMSGETLTVLDAVVACLEKERLAFNETGDRAHWHNMIQLLPSSFNQMRTVSMNYENLVNIYYARREHKLAEWHDLCDWIMTLPYARELIAVRDEKAAEN